MTAFTNDTDLNARGRRLAGVRQAAEAHFRRLFGGLPALFAVRPADPVETLAKAARREAARRAVDNLLR